jgi:hypothetical protein
MSARTDFHCSRRVAAILYNSWDVSDLHSRASPNGNHTKSLRKFIRAAHSFDENGTEATDDSLA